MASLEDDVRSDRDFRRKLGRTTFSPVYSLVLLVGCLLSLVFLLLHNLRWVDHTNLVIQRGLAVDRLLLDLQSAARGYQLTGNAIFLEPYRKARPELPAAIAALQDAVQDNPAQVELANEIARETSDWLELVTTASPSVMNATPSPAKATTLSALVSKNKFDGIRQDLAAFLEREQSLRELRAARVRRWTWITLLVTGGATAVVGLVQCRGMRRSMGDLSASYRSLLRLARDRRLQTESLLGELDDELKAVGEIQRSLLPKRLPQIAGLDMAASYRTSRRAGGDYYDFFRLPPEYENDDRVRYGILIADVSGHGTPAAVLMAVTHSIAHGYDRPTMLPHELLEFVNRRLSEGYTSASAAFVTAFYAIYDPATRELAYSSAGHNPPRLRRAGADHFLELGDAQSLPLGVDPEERFITAGCTLAPGDTLILYTDGITEARDAEDNLLGTQRLDAALLGEHDSAREVLQSALDVVASFASDRVLDDQTLLVLRVCDEGEAACPREESEVLMNERAASLV